MRALYWLDLDCQLDISHSETVHQHFDREEDACRAFISWRIAYPAGTMPPPGKRYRCIRGPKGLVRGVVP